MEHYGFEISPSVLRRATLKHAERAKQLLENQYDKSYRSLPATGAEHVIAEVDGTMICTVKNGKRNKKRPREWHEMRLSAAQAKGSIRSEYAATFGSVDMVGRRWGHCALNAGRGINSRIVEFIALVMERNGSVCKVRKCSELRDIFYVTFIM